MNSVSGDRLFYELNGELVEKKEITTTGKKLKVSRGDVERTLVELGEGM